MEVSAPKEISLKVRDLFSQELLKPRKVANIHSFGPNNLYNLWSYPIDHHSSFNILGYTIEGLTENSNFPIYVCRSRLQKLSSSLYEISKKKEVAWSDLQHLSLKFQHKGCSHPDNKQSLSIQIVQGKRQLSILASQHQEFTESSLELNFDAFQKIESPLKTHVQFILQESFESIDNLVKTDSVYYIKRPLK